MTYTRSVGDEQIIEWPGCSDHERDILRLAREKIAKGLFKDAHSLLTPLLNSNNPVAQYLEAGQSLEHETEQEFNQRHLHLIQQSADQEYPPAVFVLGVYYDTGELVIENKIRAAQLFKCAAEGKHAASQCTHGINLLYGHHGIEKDEKNGIAVILQSVEARYQGALETLALFYEKGQFGFPVDPQIAQSLRKRATHDNVIGY